jgi:hypothetical protein
VRPNFDPQSWHLQRAQPPAEVAAAGHDRCIIPIEEASIDAWLNRDTPGSYAGNPGESRPILLRASVGGVVAIIDHLA